MTRLLKSTDSNFIRLLLTTGDEDGIGWEVTRKALEALGPLKGVQFICFRGTGRGPGVRGGFKTVSAHSVEEALALPRDQRLLAIIRDGQPPARWVERATEACLRGWCSGLVTAPLSKTSIAHAGMKDVGHTEILQRLSGTTPLFMGFLGTKFNVLLATGHLPLGAAIRSLNLSHFNRVTQAARSLRETLPPAKRRLPLAFVGINPHAGEGGLIGDEEGWMRGYIEGLRARGERAVGPLVPDAAFLPKNWPLYSVYICPYHDQGLIPFKLVHGFKAGVHVTMGLPFVRTSVDHGTAKDLWGKNKAEAGSMKEAIKTAVRLCRERRTTA